MARNTKLTKPDVVARINDLLNNNTGKYGKYQRNYSLYNQTIVADLRAKVPETVGFFDDVYSEETDVPKLNVIKSCCDSVVSKITTAHVRPFVNTVKGSFKTVQICKQLQIFIDYFFDEQNVQSKASEALRDACVFDTGYMYLNEEDGSIINVAPWNVYTRQNEKNDFKSAYIEFPQTSVDTLSDKDWDLLTNAEKRNLYVTIGYFYDSRTKTKATLINRNIRRIEQIESEYVPLVAIHYTMPICGTSNLSITDMLKGIQFEIDELMKRIAEASAVNPALTFFVNNASNIKVGQLNNRVGNIVQYTSPEGGQPVYSAHDEFISSQYMTTLDNLMEKAYNMVGISQLSAQGKKPSGLDSGVALATQADLESDRFQVLLDQYIKLYTDLAKLCMRTFQNKKDILPPSRYNLSLTWKEVEEEFDKLRIQFSAADSLSKDPSEKLKQLQTLAQAGIIPATMIPSLLELPDINRGYSVANNSYNACQTLIDQCIYENKFEIPDYLSMQMLKEQIINMQLSLRVAQGAEKNNEKDIERLTKYYEMIEDKEQGLEQPTEGELLSEEEAPEETASMQEQATAQDTSLNNAYAQNGTEDNLNMNNEGTANPMQTSAANSGELGG